MTREAWRWIGAIWLAVCGGAWAGSESARFRYTLPLRLPDSAQEELAELLLTPQVYAATRTDLADIRIVGAERGEAVPCLVECVTQERQERVRQAVGLRLVKAEELDGRRLRVTLEREADAAAREAAPLCGVAIRSPLKDYVRQVAVEVSDDGATWAAAVEAAQIVDLSSHADFHQSEIGLPAFKGRHLRLTVDKMDDMRVGAESAVTTVSDAGGVARSIERRLVEAMRPFRIDGVDGWAEQARWVRDARPLSAREVRVVADIPRELKARYPDARLICFAAGRMPLERVVLRSPASILRQAYVLLEQSDAPARMGLSEWRQTAAGTVSRIVFRDFKQERLEVTFPESRAACYCLVLADRGGAAALEVAGGAGSDYRVVFPYGAGESRTLLAGDPAAEGCGYQPEEIRVLLRKGYRTVRAQALGGWRENPVWRGSRGRSWLSDRPWFLPAAVTLAIVALGVAVMAAFMRLPAPEE